MRDREKRLPTDAAIRVFHEAQAYRADAVNISANGASLIGVGRLPRAAKVTICYLHLCIRAEVAWSTAEQTGVRFAAPLTSSQLKALRASGPGRVEE